MRDENVGAMLFLRSSFSLQLSSLLRATLRLSSSRFQLTGQALCDCAICSRCYVRPLPLSRRCALALLVVASSWQWLESLLQLRRLRHQCSPLQLCVRAVTIRAHPAPPGPSILRAQGSNGIKIFAQAPGPFVVDLGKFFNSHRSHLRGVLNLISGKPLRGEVFRIVNNKSLFVVSLYAGQIICELRLDSLAAKYDLHVVCLDVFFFGVIEEFPLDINGNRIAKRGPPVLNRQHGSRRFS